MRKPVWFSTRPEPTKNRRWFCDHRRPNPLPAAIIPAGESPYYSPAARRPHITLAKEDVSPAALDQVVAHLSRTPLRWQVAVDNLAVIEQLAVCLFTDGPDERVVLPTCTYVIQIPC